MALVPDIQAIVGEYFDLNVAALRGPSHLHRVVRGRQVAMYLMWTFTRRNKAEIGRLFCREHSTVIHAIKIISRLRRADRRLACDLLALKSKIAAAQRRLDAIPRGIANPFSRAAGARQDEEAAA